MPTSDLQHIELQSSDLFHRIEQIHRSPQPTLENLKSKYILFYKLLEQACYELTATATLTFANLFSRLDYIGKEKKMTPSDRYAVQTLRRNCNIALRGNFQADMQEYLYDLRALVRFIALGFEADVPATLLPELPHSNRPYKGTKLSHIPYVRASVTSWTDSQIYAATDSDQDPFIIINYAKGGYNGDLLYLKELLTENLPINLLDVRIDEENHYIPKLIVIHPDYLIDISSLAACFREYGHHPYNYFMNKIKPRPNTAPILLGNLASQFLDDYINEQAESPVSYTESFKKYFASSALEFCTCPLPETFHIQAQSQLLNLRSFVHDILPHNLQAFDRRKTLLEASFICEKLGLQGRVDMLQKDFKILIEQKSGKRDERQRKHKEDHFIQMMLYQGVLMYNFGRETEELQTFLLYSKYPDGLTLEHFSENLFRESIRLRNLIVAEEMKLGEGNISHLIETLNTDTLNEYQVHNRLWNDFQEPQLQETIQTLKHTTPLERAYFQRFFTFISKEQILSKTGGNTDPAHGFAGLWHLPLPEKLEAGNILLGLTIRSKQQSATNKGYDLIELNIPEQDEDFLPNFRTGDIVICYAYQGEPDVRKEILMKGNIVSIFPDKLTILLRNGQQNREIIGKESDVFAVEHDSSDVSATNGFRGLYAFLSARTDRKELLLGIRQPTKNPEIRLNGSYGRFDTLILKEKQATDYFLLVGPPGTGKTSCALRYMVEEALTDPETSILLLSYTNRAVDEICHMLVSSGIAAHTPFIRIGNELSCDSRYVPYLLKNSLNDCPKLKDIQQRICETRIFVGTTTAINNRLHLFSLKTFTLAIIDEASQILEPDLIGILSARHQTQNAVGKFVLIGDYKQLPAIAQQRAEEAAVDNPLLHTIGLTDCRNSFFERLYRQSDESVRSILHKQGRMHPAIAEFPNNTFYYREQLESVPLPHQEASCPYPETPATADTIDHLLLERRMVFIPAAEPLPSGLSDKTNRSEARIVAVLLEHIYRLTKNTFDPHTTVGVIVPYRNQIAMIRKEISQLNLPALLDISIDTVERYQGSQRDVIIYSFTVHDYHQLNFLTANTFQEGEFLIDRKLNVAITRARKQLLLTGNPTILGANLTFYKLMEYIRLHNGYIDTTPNAFCQGKFLIPAYRKGWDTQTDTYTLPPILEEAIRTTIYLPLEPITGKNIQDSIYDTYYREQLAYGRINFRMLETDGIPTQNRALLYNAYYFRRQYMSAQALLETCGSWLRDAIASAAGRIVYCDLSNESGASALAFTDYCRRFPHTDLAHVTVYPSESLQKLTEQFFQIPAYRTATHLYCPRLSAVPPRFWKVHTVVPELVIFNLSNLFDRITPQEARDLAWQINRLMQSYPLNKYLTIFRDDAGERGNNRPYIAFCNQLCTELRQLNEQMPFSGKFYYTVRKNGDCPDTETFIYELRSNL